MQAVSSLPYLLGVGLGIKNPCLSRSGKNTTIAITATLVIATAFDNVLLKVK